MENDLMSRQVTFGAGCAVLMKKDHELSVRSPCSVTWTSAPSSSPTPAGRATTAAPIPDAVLNYLEDAHEQIDMVPKERKLLYLPP